MPIYNVFDRQNSKQVVGGEVDDVFEQAVPLLRKALKHANGELTEYHIYRFVQAGLMQLWVGYERGEVAAVMVTEIADYPLKRVVRVLALAGKTAPFEDTFERIKLWAAENGAVELEAYCRPAVTRLIRRWGFFKLRDQVCLDLRRKLQ